MRWRSSFVLFTSLFCTSVLAQDEFDWLRDDARSNGEVKQFLSEQDNATTEYLKGNETLKQALLDEWQNDNVVKADSPWLLIRGMYYKLGVKNGQRAILMKSTQSASEEVLLDLSSRQQDHDYYHLAAWRLSSDGSKIALAEDITGTGEHRISVVDLEMDSESVVADGTESTILWSSDSQSIFVIKQELPTLRPYKLVQIDLKSKKQTPVFTESDSAWLVSAYLASDSHWAVIQSNNESSVEQVLLNLKTGALSKTLLPRKDGKEYFADVVDDQLFLNSNHNNGFAIWKKSLRSETGEFQLIFRPESGEVIDNFYLFESALVVATLRGQDKYLTAVLNGKTLWKISLSEDGVVTWVKRNGDFSSNRIRLRSMSLIQPPKWSELDVKSGKVSDLSSDFYPEHHPQNYVSKQIWVEKGSIRVPVTLAYRKDTLTENSPVILYGYGAYGVTMRPYFMPQIVCVLNQGAIYAIAHVRGGGFLGRDWHVSGRGINKQNGIDDFHVASQFMKTFKRGQRPVLAIGGSAGGTLVAAAINQKPDLYQGAVLQVPFLDVVNSMSDSTLPLSDQQHLEWGNPKDAQEQRVMLEFDPYQNLKKQSYPPVLVRVGYQDRRVPFWEGAKYIARMQKLSTADNPYLLRTDFVSGHRPDRRHAQNFQAEEYAFLLSLVQHSSAE
ncbi:putative Peptidase S9A, prolyl oligopeptidase [Vibrio nigripulchritudo MADA3029]|uniref:prolyl oligopeptidase family serine peptidase n=1 Tax=Vibrio nigripulchritudo TaxID=28173 RepID=UPI0003B1E0E3|nr:prolyl oligopeptidase family serine peptidase [Vibrio nigripulchritudo]CCN45334.1 putative Peptidase S9A, prolyl oligopeptidase [Vibrio nigripulchritudo MADA3020]CCN51782.1 putative Peptidase S9A, prolyl oligopeptidase [Vibrio nigripulchritudo MADA3021]CCN61946.1 putative Peptidase S9A, prolyl oligopeptidase [Vibrio nigripulchritudo MADA3029]